MHRFAPRLFRWNPIVRHACDPLVLEGCHLHKNMPLSVHSIAEHDATPAGNHTGAVCARKTRDEDGRRGALAEPSLGKAVEEHHGSFSWKGSDEAMNVVGLLQRGCSDYDHAVVTSRRLRLQTFALDGRRFLFLVKIQRRIFQCNHGTKKRRIFERLIPRHGFSRVVPRHHQHDFCLRPLRLAHDRCENRRVMAHQDRPHKLRRPNRVLRDGNPRIGSPRGNVNLDARGHREGGCGRCGGE
mmetsp:Transcript_1300/g.3572  ORF Transcript_1300/g.3572 Transcript_1300/m.3572 type:complete len:241 (-) Transcript_1300:277-999(-)